jgi:hypothetical protein
LKVVAIAAEASPFPSIEVSLKNPIGGEVSPNDTLAKEETSFEVLCIHPLSIHCLAVNKNFK